MRQVLETFGGVDVMGKPILLMTFFSFKKELIRVCMRPKFLDVEREEKSADVTIVKKIQE